MGVKVVSLVVVVVIALLQDAQGLSVDDLFPYNTPDRGVLPAENGASVKVAVEGELMFFGRSVDAFLVSELLPARGPPNYYNQCNLTQFCCNFRTDS